MRRRDIIIGFIVLVVLVVGALVIKNSRKNSLPEITTPTIEEQIENKFNGIEIPEDVEKAELRDVSGGNGAGIATSDTVLADLPELEPGYFYQVWKEVDGRLTSIGKMRLAKGGYLLEGNISEKVVVSLERTFDSTLETKILEGSF